jgi:hypothetical protein
MNLVDEIEYETFDPEEHLRGILTLCEAEGSESFRHRSRRGYRIYPGGN